MEKLIIEDIEIELTKKKVKNINLSIHAPNGLIKISAPTSMSNEAIRLFVLSKIPWIRKQQLKFLTTDILPDKEYRTGEVHHLFGQEYLLNIIINKSIKDKVVIRDNLFIDVYVKEFTKEKIELMMKEWYRVELKNVIPPLIEKWEGEMSVNVKSWGIKQMKTRWGTCNIKNRRIWINLELAKKSPECLEYLIVHELVHLLERGHGERFKALMNSYYPNWKNVKAELNGIIVNKV